MVAEVVLRNSKTMSVLESNEPPRDKRVDEDGSNNVSRRCPKQGDEAWYLAPNRLQAHGAAFEG